MQLADADQAQQAVPQILTLNENEKREDQHEAEHRDGREKRFGQSLEMSDRAGFGRHHLHGQGIVARWRGRGPVREALSREFLTDGGHIFLDAAQRSGGGRPESLHFVVDVLRCKRAGGRSTSISSLPTIQLTTPAKLTMATMTTMTDGDASEMDALKPDGERSQDQAERQSEGERDKDFPGEIKDGEGRDHRADQREGRPLVRDRSADRRFGSTVNRCAGRGPKPRSLLISGLPARMAASQDGF